MLQKFDIKPLLISLENQAYRRTLNVYSFGFCRFENTCLLQIQKNVKIVMPFSLFPSCREIYVFEPIQALNLSKSLNQIIAGFF